MALRVEPGQAEPVYAGAVLEHEQVEVILDPSIIGGAHTLFGRIGKPFPVVPGAEIDRDDLHRPPAGTAADADPLTQGGGPEVLDLEPVAAGAADGRPEVRRGEKDFLQEGRCRWSPYD